jgi:hypothetical protein
LPTDPYHRNQAEFIGSTELSAQAEINLRLWHRHDTDLYNECRRLVAEAAAGAGPDPEPFAVELGGPYQHDEALAWTVALPAPLRTLTADQDSSVALFEDSTRLLPTNAMQADIRRHGGGAHAFWPGALCFSTSDDSDPNFNGRRYFVGSTEGRPYGDSKTSEHSVPPSSGSRSSQFG